MICDRASISSSGGVLCRRSSAAHEIPYHVVLKERAIIEDTEEGTTRELMNGDIVLVTRGSAHASRRQWAHAGPSPQSPMFRRMDAQRE
jgi:hypothetical protein